MNKATVHDFNRIIGKADGKRLALTLRMKDKFMAGTKTVYQPCIKRGKPAEIRIQLVVYNLELAIKWYTEKSQDDDYNHVKDKLIHTLRVLIFINEKLNQERLEEVNTKLKSIGYDCITGKII